jgi:cytochrome P450
MPSPWAALRALRRDVLGLWPRAAYEDEFVRGHIFSKPFVLLNGADAIQRILVDNLENYRRPPPTVRILAPIVGGGLLLSEGEEWKKQRRIVAPAFANRFVPVLARHVASASHEIMSEILAAPADMTDLLATAQRLALDIAARSMFSLDLGPRGGLLRSMIESYRPRLGRPGVLDIVLPSAVSSPRDIARRGFRSRWTRLMDAVVASRPDAPAEDAARDLFDLLKAARDPNTGLGLSPDQLRDQVATMILAGHETTALAIFWSAFLVAAAPAAQARIADEVRGLDLGPGAAGPALQRLPFTRAVVSEALRLYPPAFLIARQAEAADRCGAIEIPRGALVIISPWVLHRHQSRWPAPDAFDPTRFLGDRPVPRYAYMPFGAGPRVCVGAQFGLAEAVLVLAILVQTFELGLADMRPVIPAAVVSMQPERPVRFRLRPRRA